MIETNKIYEELKKYVFGQDEYLKQLAITGYKHQLNQLLIEEGKNRLENNLLVIGPTGCGKTFAVKHLSKIIDVPFYEIDCSNLVQVGYKGSCDIETELTRIIKSERTEKVKAIVYLDEFDKILDKALLVDGKGKSSQQNFLKVLEPNVIQVSTSERGSTKFGLDTSGLTFIATGSFEEIKEQIREKRSMGMGFTSSEKKNAEITLDDKDLTANGYMPELIGRFSTIFNINTLTENDYYNIIKHGDDSSLKTYGNIFNTQDVELKISDRVFKEVARRAKNSGIGARGILKELNKVLDVCLSEVSNDSTVSMVNVGFANDKFRIGLSHAEKRKKRNELRKKEKQMISKETVDEEVKDMITGYELSLKYEKAVKNFFDAFIFRLDDELEVEELIKKVENEKDDQIQTFMKYMAIHTNEQFILTKYTVMACDGLISYCRALINENEEGKNND